MEDSACFGESLTDNEVIKGALICLILAYTTEFFWPMEVMRIVFSFVSS